MRSDNWPGYSSMPTSRKAVVITSPVPKLFVSPQALSVAARLLSLYMPNTFLHLQIISTVL